MSLVIKASPNVPFNTNEENLPFFTVALDNVREWMKRRKRGRGRKAEE